MSDKFKPIEEITEAELQELWPLIGGAPHLFEYGKDELRKGLSNGQFESLQMDYYTMAAIVDYLRSKGYEAGTPPLHPSESAGVKGWANASKPPGITQWYIVKCDHKRWASMIYVDSNITLERVAKDLGVEVDKMWYLDENATAAQGNEDAEKDLCHDDELFKLVQEVAYGQYGSEQMDDAVYKMGLIKKFISDRYIKQK